MGELLEYLREINIASIVLRLILSVLCSGIIGIERGKMRRAAGFRTHILVCMGATIVMITNQYISVRFGNSGDISRMGAQVISGIGFLGAGTIIVDRKNNVKGLTTAAGLWACTCMGLAIGIGFYEGAILSCLFLLIVVIGLHKFDSIVCGNSRKINIYAELDDIVYVTGFIASIKENGVQISDLDMKISKEKSEKSIGIVMKLRFLKRCDHVQYIDSLNKTQGVNFIEEIA